MFEMIHTESPGHVGYSLAIVFYFICIGALFLLVTQLIMPLAKSIFGKTAAVALSHIIA